VTGAASLPLSGRLLIVAVVTAGTVTAAFWLTDVTAWSGRDVLAWAGLAAATAACERFPIVLLLRRERDVYSLSDAIWTASVLLVQPSVVALAVGAGALAGQALLGRDPVKVAFNVGQYVLGITLALAVFGALGSPPADDPKGWLAVALAMAAFQALNTTVVGAMIALAEGRPMHDVMLAGTGLTHLAGNIAAGILAALVWLAQPLALPLLAVPLALTYFAYRGWLRTLQERDWMARMGRNADSIVTSGDLTTRIAEGGGDDAVGQLGATLNRMLARLEASFERERIFIRESSHELRTPITICRGHLEVMSDVPDAEEVDETRSVLLDELDRMTRIIEDMNDLAFMEDPDSLRRSPVELDRFVSDVAAKARPLLDGRLQIHPVPSRAPVHGDPQRLTQALINLLKNARDHTPDGTPIDLRVVADNGSWRFEVADHGGGLPAGQEDHVFEPFFKRDFSSGSGLGLAIVSGIARAHGGAAGVENRRGEGATFWMRIPR